MRNIALFVLSSALFINGMVAQAGDDRRNGRLELQCRYLGAAAVPVGGPVGLPGPIGGPGFGGPGGPKGGPKGGPIVGGGAALIPTECLVRARIRERNDDDNWLAAPSSPVSASAEAPTLAGPTSGGPGLAGGGGDDFGRDFGRRDRLEIFCDGVPIYADGAVRADVGGYEFLSGISTPITPIGPILKFQSFNFGGDDLVDGRGGSEDRRRRSFVVDSWLNIGGNVMAGFCAVERRDRRAETELNTLQ